MIESEEAWNKYYYYLGPIQTLIFQSMVDSGKVLINKQPLMEHKIPSFFRSIFIQPRVRPEDVDTVIEYIESFGAEISFEDVMKMDSEENLFN